MEMADKQQLPPLAGVVMLASASLTACIPNMEWWHAQQSSMHAVKVIWSVPLASSCTLALHRLQALLRAYCAACLGGFKHLLGSGMVMFA